MVSPTSVSASITGGEDHMNLSATCFRSRARVGRSRADSSTPSTQTLAILVLFDGTSIRVVVASCQRKGSRSGRCPRVVRTFAPPVWSSPSVPPSLHRGPGALPSPSSLGPPSPAPLPYPPPLPAPSSPSLISPPPRTEWRDPPTFPRRGRASPPPFPPSPSSVPPALFLSPSLSLRCSTRGFPSSPPPPLMILDRASYQ